MTSLQNRLNAKAKRLRWLGIIFAIFSLVDIALLWWEYRHLAEFWLIFVALLSFPFALLTNYYFFRSILRSNNPDAIKIQGYKLATVFMTSWLILTGSDFYFGQTSRNFLEELCHFAQMLLITGFFVSLSLLARRGDEANESFPVQE